MAGDLGNCFQAVKRKETLHSKLNALRPKPCTLNPKPLYSGSEGVLQGTEPYYNYRPHPVGRSIPSYKLRKTLNPKP